WIVTKVIDQIAPAHIEHGADRNEGAKADVLLQTPIENRGTERTTLADKRYITWSGNRACKGGVQTTSWVHQAQTVGADDAHIATASLFEYLALKLSTLWAYL